MKQIGMIGEGAWGTAVATLLAHNGYTVKLWCYNKELVHQINTDHINNRYLPDIQLDSKIIATDSLEDAIYESDWVFEAIPVQYLREVLKDAASYCRPNQHWVVLSKGIERDSFLLPTQIIQDTFETLVQISVCAGPSFALDVANKQITAVTLAAVDCHEGRALQKIMASDYFRPYTTTDVIGVQASAALKNVITLAVGILEGAGYTDNLQAFIFTQGLYEVGKLVSALGGRRETVYGLSGVGDLWLTASGDLSRNLQVGRRLGTGETLQQIIEQTGYTPEGVNTVYAVYELMHKQAVSLPISAGVYEMLFAGKSVDHFLNDIMTLPLDSECRI